MGTAVPLKTVGSQAPASRDQLILRYAPLVRHAVGQFTAVPPAALDAEDIYSYGTMGLIDAIDRFDASRGVKFETYAVTRIRGFLIDELRMLDWLPRTARTRASNVRRTTARMEEQLGRKPNQQELATATGFTPEACARALVDGGCQVLSLDTLSAIDDENNPMSLLQRLEDDNSPNPALTSEQNELRAGVAQALSQLSERERKLLSMRYEQGLTLKQIALHLSISESRASQLHSQALARIKRILLGMFDDLAARRA